MSIKQIQKMKLSKEQFIEMVISLEHRNLTMGLEISSDLGDIEDEIPAEAAAKIEEFEKLQHELYSCASECNMQDQFKKGEDTDLLVIKPDSDLEQIVWDSIEKMEKSVAYEMVLRHKAIELAQKIREEKSPKEPTPEEMFPRIEELTKKYWTHMEEKGLDDLIKEL